LLEIALLKPELPGSQPELLTDWRDRAPLWNLDTADSFPVSLLYGVLSIFGAGARLSSETIPMSFDTNHEAGLAELPEQLRHTQAVTPELMAEVIARACRRFSAHPSSATARITRLIESGAFVDATLALFALQLPQWKLRRLAYDDGQWHCAFSRQLALPPELDQTADASHEILPLALLGAFVEAQRCGPAADDSRPSSVPQVKTIEGYATISLDPAVRTSLAGTTERASAQCKIQFEQTIMQMLRPAVTPQPNSRQVLFRSAFRLVLLSALAAFGSRGFGQTLAAVLALAAIFCTVTATMRGEAIFGRALTHWDEAATYIVLSGLVATSV
jgi:hypothetical protein